MQVHTHVWICAQPREEAQFSADTHGVQPWKVNKNVWSHPQLWLVQPPWMGGQDGVPQRANATPEPVGTPEDDENTSAALWDKNPCPNTVD